MRTATRFLFFYLLLPGWIHAQLTVPNRYAVIVGVNDYYISPGVKHSSSLHGCVNDAYSIKGLLVNRFGFTESSIAMLTNESVTKKNVIDLMQRTLQQCRPGDAFVFYFSGHGVWMSNT